MTQRLIVLGALSEIAEETCRLYAREGAQFVLAARDRSRLQDVAKNLEADGAKNVLIEVVDLTQINPGEALPKWIAQLGGVDVVLLAYGLLGNQETLERDLESAAKLIDVNFRSAALWSLSVANELEAAQHGTLVVIGSVAGDRGRKSNFLYGATKAGLGVLVEGIAHRLAASGAKAVLVKPGFVDTAMTAHIEKKGVLWSSPQKLASLIRKAADGNRPVVYAPGYWRLIMSIIRNVPAQIFHRTKL